MRWCALMASRAPQRVGALARHLGVSSGASGSSSGDALPSSVVLSSAGAVSASASASPSASVAAPAAAGAAGTGETYVPPAQLPVGPMHASEWRRFPLVQRVDVNYNTRVFRFGLHAPDAVLDLPTGKHISLRALDGDGKVAMRSYTPISTHADRGFFELVVKVYPRGVMSQFLEHLALGDFVAVRGPKGRFSYTPNMKRSIGMIAGGSGITPMLQVARHVLADKDDRTALSLVYANVAERDILLRDELDGLAAAHPGRFRVFYVLQEAPVGWTGGTGFVSPDIIRAHIGLPSADTLVTLCGPTPMNKAMETHLETLGYPKDSVFRF